MGSTAVVSSVILSVVLMIAVAPTVPVDAQQSPKIPLDALEAQVIQEVNQYRIDNGFDMLQPNNAISDVARNHSEDMKRTGMFQHDTPGKPNYDSIMRGINAGFTMCGDMESIELYEKTTKGIAEYKKKLKEYETNSQYFAQFRSDDVSLFNKIHADGKWLDEKFVTLSRDIEQVNDDINNHRIGMGLVENLMLFEGIPENITVRELADETLQGWIDSPDHHEVLFSDVHSIGVGITQTEDNDKLYVTLNMC